MGMKNAEKKNARSTVVTGHARMESPHRDRHWCSPVKFIGATALRGKKTKKSHVTLEVLEFLFAYSEKLPGIVLVTTNSRAGNNWFWDFRATRLGKENFFK
jgi:hypothetical protein